MTVPAGERLGYYLVQDDTTAGYLASPPTYPSNYASDGQADPQNPYDGHPNVFFVDPGANADHFQHFIVLPGGAYGVEDSTGGGDEDFNDLVFTLSSLNVPVLTATPASDHTHIDVNWTADTTNVAGYELQREVVGSGTFSDLANITNPAAAGFMDTSATSGTDYGYRLKPYELVNGNQVFGSNSNIATAHLAIGNDQWRDG